MDGMDLFGKNVLIFEDTSMEQVVLLLPLVHYPGAP
jgi:hypothetical protein